MVGFLWVNKNIRPQYTIRRYRVFHALANKVFILKEDFPQTKGQSVQTGVDRFKFTLPYYPAYTSNL